MVAVLSDYPIDVIRRVVDPRTGLPSRQQFLPTITEVKTACEEIYGPIRRRREWDARAVRQIQERAKLEGRPVPSPDEVKAELAKQGVVIEIEHVAAIEFNR